jgi:transposase
MYFSMKEFQTIAQLASWFGKSERTIYNWIKKFEGGLSKKEE